MMRHRYELTDHEWSVMSPLLPNKPHDVPRVDDRRGLNGALWLLRTGSSRAELGVHWIPPITCRNRVARWCKPCVLDGFLKAYDSGIVMIDSSCALIHQHAATRKGISNDGGMGRSLGSLTRKTHARVRNR